MNKKLNILMVVQNNSFPFDSRVYNEALSLKRNFNIFVISPKSDIDNEYFEKISNIKIYRYNNYESVGSMFGYILEYSNAFLRISFLSIYIAIKYKIKIIHFANPPDIFWPLMLLLKIFNIKCIYDQHDIVPELFRVKFGNKPFYKILQINEIFTAKIADGIIFASSSFVSRMEKKINLASKFYETIYSGPRNNFNAIYNKNLLKKFDNKFVALFVGLMSKNDNVEIIVKLAKVITNDYKIKDIIFILVGDGDQKKSIMQLVKNENLSEYFYFTGLVEQKKVQEYLAIANICLLPDKPNGFNEYVTHMKVFEYMKVKKSFISFELNEIMHLAKSAGFFSKDFNSYVNNFLEAYKNPFRADEKGNIGYELVKNKYGWEKQKEKLDNLYKKIVFVSK